MNRIETNDYIVDYDDTQEIKDKVFARLIEWYKEHESFSGECICQSDDPIIDSPNVLSDIADNIIKFKEIWKDNF